MYEMTFENLLLAILLHCVSVRASSDTHNALALVKHSSSDDSLMMPRHEAMMSAYSNSSSSSNKTEQHHRFGHHNHHRSKRLVGAYEGHDLLLHMDIPDDNCWRPEVRIVCDELYPYRSYDGKCNNLEHFWWGAVDTAYRRMLPANYMDGRSHVRRTSVVDKELELPGARLLSLEIHTVYPTNSRWSNFLVTFGQNLGHDVIRTPISGDPDQPKCKCTRPESDECIHIRVPANDHYLGKKGTTCIPFQRANPQWPNRPCATPARRQINQQTSFLDLGFVYASKSIEKWRAWRDGLLNYEYLPNGEVVFPLHSTECPLGSSEAVFLSPDSNAEQNTYLAGMQLLWYRNHNAIATGLVNTVPDWDDERLFQEARRINIAMYQHVTYGEFLPLVIGRSMAEKYDLLPLKPGAGYCHGYDANVDPQIMSEFAGASFRLHTLLNHEQCYADEMLNIESCHGISEGIRTSRDACRSMDHVLRGLVARAGYHRSPPSQHIDFVHNVEFLKEHNTHTIQRGRDFGLHVYNVFRQVVGLDKAHTFDDFNNISERARKLLKRFYAHPDDVDLWIGGINELPIEDGIIGKTFSTIIARQLRDLKRGDRFYYEHGHDKITRMHLAHLDEIREKTSMAAILCQNVDIEVISKSPFLAHNDEWNPLVECKKLPQIDFRLWREQSTKASNEL